MNLVWFGRMNHRLFFSMNSSKVKSLDSFNFKEGQDRTSRFYILRQTSLNSLVNCESVQALFMNAHQNIAITPHGEEYTAKDSDCTPLFNTMTNLRNASSVFKNFTIHDYYNEDIDPNHLGIRTWEPFEELKKLTHVAYMHFNNNIPKMFKIDFGNPEGFTSIGGFFEYCRYDFNIPYNYFDSMVKLANNDDGSFGMWYLFGSGSKISTLIDKTSGKMLMSEWNPEVPSDISINMIGLFRDGSSIPNEERLRFINNLCVIRNKTYQKLFMNRITPLDLIGGNSTVDVTPYLIDGKILNITSNVKSIDLISFNSEVPIVNIPARSVVLPDSLTEINVTDMFKNCIAHPDVTDVSEVFVYNGSAKVDWNTSGLIVGKENL